MPLYEYRCRDCGHRFEILQRLGEGAAGLACPRCRAAVLDKQFSTFAAVSVSGSAMAGIGEMGEMGGMGGMAAGCDAPDCGAGSGPCCGGGGCGMDDFD
jgi:putative FmdB family regulatory protein